MTAIVSAALVDVARGQLVRYLPPGDARRCWFQQLAAELDQPDVGRRWAVAALLGVVGTFAPSANDLKPLPATAE